MDQIKRTHQAAGAELLTQVLGAVPLTLLNLGAWAAFQIPQPLVQTVTTNVPGPLFLLHIFGRQFCKHIHTFSAESSGAPDLGILAQGIHHGLAEPQPQSATTNRAIGGGTDPPDAADH